MIEIKNLSLQYGKQKVLDNLSLKLPDKGLIAIVGPSGCGKTSLFYCLSGLTKYEGEIIFNEQFLNKYSVTQLNNFRLRNIGFVFQDFKLFNLDNVANNVAFPFNVNNGYKTIRNNQRIDDLLSLVGLLDKKDQPVRNLSGGEKQRVAIARSLINNPSLVLADEPTGALDENTSDKIMNLFKAISKDKLVVFVSHDLELVNKFCDQIITLKDGKILDICTKNSEIDTKNLVLMKNEYSKKKPSIPTSFLLRHTFASIKERKWRTILINLVTSLGLIGVGLASSLSNSISANIKKSCSSLISDNQIIINKKEVNQVVGLESKTYEECLDIEERYSSYVDGVGSIYQTNFYNHFKDCDESYIFSNKTKIGVKGYSSRQFNEFYWLDNSSESFYPNKPDYLSNEEIVITLSMGMLHDICFSLSIVGNVESLANYISNNDLYMVLHVQNKDWEYEDEQLFKVKAFALDFDAKVFHYNHLFNEMVFENNMRFPSSTYLARAEEVPWMLKKVYYLHTKNLGCRDAFLNESKRDIFMDSTILEIANKYYSPIKLDYDTDIRSIDMVLAFDNSFNYMNLRHVDKIDEYMEDLSSPIIGSRGGYAIYKEALLMGFSNYTYFASNKKELNSLLEEYSSLPNLSNQSLVLPSEIEMGHFSKIMQNGVVFNVITDYFVNNERKLSLDEIIISSGLYESLGANFNTLNIAFTFNEEKLPNGKIIRDFKQAEVRVVGIINNDKKVIYHNQDWTLDFFQSRLGVSSFNLLVEAVSFDVDKSKNIDEVIEHAKSSFPAYEVTNPLNSINEGIDEVCFYLEIAMIAFSSIAILISTFLLSTCNYLHALEIRRDIGLSRCIGVSKAESSKFVFAHSFLMSGIAFLISSVELIGIDYFISRILANYLAIDFSFSFDPKSLLFMFLLASGISLLSSFITSSRIGKFSPIESLKEL